MEENLEIEFKVLLNKETYDKLITTYPKSKSYVQINHYLIHPSLIEKRYMLRIREKTNYIELTLKQPQDHGNLETNLEINNDIKDKIINRQLVNNEIFDILKPLDSTMFDTKQTLTTLRHEIETDEGLICLDKNDYNNITDYELEFEVNDYYKGKEAFFKLIKQYNINYSNNCLSKVKRVMNSIKDEH